MERNTNVDVLTECAQSTQLKHQPDIWKVNV